MGHSQTHTHHTTAIMATRVAKAAAVDWQRITSSLGLQKDTLQALQAFRKRHGDAKVAHQQVKDLKADVDFAHYKNVLKNQEVVSQLEQTWKGFKPADYDVNAQLKDIEAARPFDQLTTGDVAKARPQLTKAVEEMVKNGKWTVPGYNEKYGSLTAI